ISSLGEFGEVSLEARRGDYFQEPGRGGASIPERVHQPARLHHITPRSRDDLMVTDSRSDRPFQDVGVLVFTPVEMREDEPPRFDRMLHDSEGSSGVRPGDFEHHPHTTERDRTAFAWLHYEDWHVDTIHSH